MKRKSYLQEQKYWSQVLIAFSQVTFGVAWASIFLPLDIYKMFVVILNLTLTIVFLTRGWFLNRK
ncbi:MAG TPA: hypothetical protein VNA13_01155 [Xanthomonadales bacterium]|nr:hypothetical protein [Xanthomonadales bacterium]